MMNVNLEIVIPNYGTGGTTRLIISGPNNGGSYSIREKDAHASISVTKDDLAAILKIIEGLSLLNRS